MFLLRDLKENDVARNWEKHVKNFERRVRKFKKRRKKLEGLRENWEGTLRTLNMVYGKDL